MYDNLKLNTSFALILLTLIGCQGIPEDTQLRDEAISRAMDSVQAAVPRAESDPTRPVYHFRPPAQWMNDPNGTIFHNGYFHLYYQHNPYGDEWGNMHWGHARSSDLVHWEHLPIALWPSKELGEEHCFSGTAWINQKGQPMLFYTSVAPEDERPSEQWAAVSDDHMLTWSKHPSNPLLELKTHGGPQYGESWRDPFLFEEDGRVFMTLGADTEDEALVPFYEASGSDLTEWEYRGTLLRRPKSDIRFFECPNFFEVDGKWMLITSPYGPLKYWVGEFDIDSLTFQPELEGILDYGDGGTFYASNIAYDETGRCLLFGWIRGFEKGRGWNGCLALPRVLTLGPDGHPRQQPVPELESLRSEHTRLSDLVLVDQARHLEGIAADSLEINLILSPGNATTTGLRVRSPGPGQGIPIVYSGSSVTVAGTTVPVKLEKGQDLELKIFLDKSVLEVFVNGGSSVVSRVVQSEEDGLGVEVFAEGGRTVVKSLDVWNMTSVW